MERDSDEVSGRRHNEQGVGKRAGIEVDRAQLKIVCDIAQNYDRWLERLKLERDNLEEKLDEKKQEVKKLEGDLANLRSDADKNEQLIQEKNKTIADLSEEITHLESKIILKDEEIADLKTTPIQPIKPQKSSKERELEKAIEEEKTELKMAENDGKIVNKKLDKQKGKLGQMEAARRNKEYAQKYGK